MKDSTEILNDLIRLAESFGWCVVIPEENDTEGIRGMVIGLPEFVDRMMEGKEVKYRLVSPDEEPPLQ